MKFLAWSTSIEYGKFYTWQLRRRCNFDRGLPLGELEPMDIQSINGSNVIWLGHSPGMTVCWMLRDWVRTVNLGSFSAHLSQSAEVLLYRSFVSWLCRLIFPKCRSLPPCSMFWPGDATYFWTCPRSWQWQRVLEKIQLHPRHCPELRWTVKFMIRLQARVLQREKEKTSEIQESTLSVEPSIWMMLSTSYPPSSQEKAQTATMTLLSLYHLSERAIVYQLGRTFSRHDTPAMVQVPSSCKRSWRETWHLETSFASCLSIRCLSRGCRYPFPTKIPFPRICVSHTTAQSMGNVSLELHPSCFHPTLLHLYVIYYALGSLKRLSIIEDLSARQALTLDLCRSRRKICPWRQTQYICAAEFFG